MGTESPWRWGRGTISAILDVIWGMSVDLSPFLDDGVVLAEVDVSRVAEGSLSQNHLGLNQRRWTGVRREILERDDWHQQTKHKRFTSPGLFGGRDSAKDA